MSLQAITDKALGLIETHPISSGIGTFATGLGTIASRIWSVISPFGKIAAAGAAGFTFGTWLSGKIDKGLSGLRGYETSLGSEIYDLVHQRKGLWKESGNIALPGGVRTPPHSDDEKYKAIGGLSRKLTGIGTGVAISSAAMAGNIPLDTRPPLSAVPAAAVRGSVVNNYPINIHPAPGMDERAIADLLVKKLEQIERAKASRARGRLRDSE